MTTCDIKIGVYDEKHSIEVLREIARDASKSYDKVAKGYNLPSHETIRNFETVTLDFLEGTLLKQVQQGQLVLDLGGGRAYASMKLAELGSNVVLGDISFQMLRYTKLESLLKLKYCQLSAFELPFKDGVFDLVMTMLCGAYLTRKSAKEIFRILKPNGIYFVTETPTDWARAVQPQRNMPLDKIWFKDHNGGVVLLPFQFIYNIDELVELVEGVGFKTIIKKTLSPGDALPSEDFSGVNRNVAKTLGVDPQMIPLLSAMICIKTL